MSDMTTTLREFQRNFKKMRQRAKAGDRIVIRDKEGVAYTFQVERANPVTLADAADDIVGSYRSEEGDLASAPKHMAGYGRS
jgi:hypothetical protein